jgi:hypothetical protein
MGRHLLLLGGGEVPIHITGKLFQPLFVSHRVLHGIRLPFRSFRVATARGPA